MIQLARDLSRDFYHGSATSPFNAMRVAIEKCRKLYKGYYKGGIFSYDEINSYLGFFDDLGFFNEKGALDLETIKQLFGASVIEAYEYNELRRYVNELQKNAKQPSAFRNFQILAKKLEEIPEYKELVEDSRRGCDKS